MAALTEKLLTGSRTFGKNESPWVSVFNLCNAAIGAGVLSFPYGFRETGVLGGLFFTSLVWVVEVFTLCLLVRVAERCNSKSYQQMVLSVLGSRMAVVTSVTMMIFLIGTMISYLIITGDVFTSVFVEKLGEDSILANRRVVVVLFALVVILPLSLQSTLTALKYSSTISVIMLTYLSVALVFIGVVHLVENGFPHDLLVWKAGIHVFVIMDIVVFAFHCHIQVVPIFAELVERPRSFWGANKEPLHEELLLDEEVIAEVVVNGGRSERVKIMDGVIFLSMSICFVGYCLVGEFGYILFQDVESDVLNNFGNKNVFMNIARIGMAVVAIVCYPVQHYPLRSIVDDAVKYAINVDSDEFSWNRHIFITLGLVSSTLGISLVVTDLGHVFSIVGSTGGVMVAFIVPGILLILGSHRAQVAHVDGTIAEDGAAARLIPRSSSQSCVQITGGTFIMMFGFIIFLATAYVTAMGLIGKD